MKKVEKNKKYRNGEQETFLSLFASTLNSTETLKAGKLREKSEQRKEKIQKMLQINHYDNKIKKIYTYILYVLETKLLLKTNHIVADGFN